MLSIMAFDLGRCAMRELMLGLIAVGLAAGMAVGHTTERFRRARKDHATAVATVPKTHKIMIVERRKAAMTVAFISITMLIVFLGVLNIGKS
jgi:hypothetical protein